MIFECSLCVLSVTQQGEQVGERAPGRRPLGRINTLFGVIEKRVLSRNLD